MAYAVGMCASGARPKNILEFRVNTVIFGVGNGKQMNRYEAANSKILILKSKI
jgi:hypothetical protein